MFKTGLVSISFRNLDCDRLIELAAEAGLNAIEWGGDVHVPHGDLAKAAAVRQKCAAGRIEVAAYGSYYRVGESEKNGLKFIDVMNSALELGAPLIRVWAGNKGSALHTLAERQVVADDLRRIADMAGNAGIKVATEYHGNTLTDDNDSAYALVFEEAAHPALLTFWQPPNGKPADYCLAGLGKVLPKLASIHIFHWLFPDGKQDIRPLEEGREVWMKYLAAAAKAPGTHCVTLEFFKDNSVEQFKQDAATLKQWIAGQ